MDVPTLEGWMEKLGYESARDGASTLRVRPRDGRKLPPFFLQCTENWLLLSMIPMVERGAFRPDDLGLRLLAANREMRVAKFALDAHDDVVLCAELPTESLDFSELADAVERMVEYAKSFREDLLGVS